MWDALTLRVAARYRKQADLRPPLGDPGGPCQVMQRVDERIRNPRLKEDLLEDLQHGQSLSNADAAKVYPLDRESGAGFAQSLLIPAHAQYRMDLRGIQVEDVQHTLIGFAGKLNTWKERGHPYYDSFAAILARGQRVEWVDPRTGLKVVFVLEGGDTVSLVTAFWKGEPDPPPTPVDTCNL